MAEDLKGLVAPQKAQIIGKVIIGLLFVTQLWVAPEIEAVGTYMLLLTVPLTLGLYFCFCKFQPVLHVLFWLNIGIWLMVITPALAFLLPLAAMQINCYRHWKRGITT